MQFSGVIINNMEKNMNEAKEHTYIAQKLESCLYTMIFLDINKEAYYLQKKVYLCNSVTL